MTLPIYLDYNGTTPLAPEVIDAMPPFLATEFGNPSSNHWYGIKPKQAIMAVRVQFAGILGCMTSEIIFTSGGSESNNHAIKSFAGARHAQGGHIRTSSIEHPAILEVCRFMEGRGFAVRVLPVDADGLVSPSDVAASAGAACHADQVEISHVLKAMKVPKQWAKGTLRFTTGKYTTAAEIDRALKAIVTAIKKLRA